MIHKSSLPKNVSQKLKSFVDLNDLPDDLYISTTTLTCEWPVQMFPENIGKYIDLSEGSVVTVKYGNDPKNLRTLINTKKKTKRQKKPAKNFYNQATIVIESKNKKYINIKLFRNGAIQITGCKSISHFTDAITKLYEQLRKSKAIYDKAEKKIVRKPFVSDPDKIGLENLKNFKIRMINSNFSVGFKIDREKFYQLLKTKDIECIYEPCTHACVNVKYNYKNTDTISIFVFESGSIIITGAKNRDQIFKAYKFINEQLFDNFHEVVKNNSFETIRKSKKVQEKEVKDSKSVKSSKSVKTMKTTDELIKAVKIY